MTDRYELLVKEIRRRINDDDMTVLATRHALASILVKIGEPIDGYDFQPRRAAQTAPREAEKALG